MAIKQKAFGLAVILGLVLGFCTGLPATTMAQSTPTTDTSVTDTPQTPAETCTAEEGYSCCGKVKTSLIGGAVCGSNSDSKEIKDSTIWHLLLLILNIMTAGIGIAAVGGIVFGAILYTTAEDKPEQTKRAISIITNVVVGLIAYGLMYVLLNFLIPGGIFS